MDMDPFNTLHAQSNWIRPLKKRLGFLVSPTRYVRDMNKKIDKLEQDINLGNNNLVVSDHMLSLLEDVNKIKRETKSIGINGIGRLNMANRYKVGKKSYNMHDHLKDLEKQVSNFMVLKEEILLHEGLSGPSASTQVPHDIQSKFESRDSIFNYALHSLQSNNESKQMIALCGRAGVGKTTMMEQLKKVLEDSKMFNRVVKVNLGVNPNPFDLQRDISECIGVDLTDTTKDARASRLRKRFEEISQQGKKNILVLMDDVWEEVNLKDVGLTSPLPNGFKMLFTSRFENVCIQMGVNSKSILKIGILNDVEAETFFFGFVTPTIIDGDVKKKTILDSDDFEFQTIGKEIVKKCGGLPIALKTIAKSLCGNANKAWKKALSDLHHNEPYPGMVEKVFEISYNNLKREDDKALFLLSGLFPDNVNIPIEDLMIYGWGLKVFSNAHTLAEAREHTNSCVSNLIRANLFTESDRMGCFRMHDLVRAFVLNNFSKVKQASLVNHDKMCLAKESFDRLLLKCNGMSTFPTDFHYPDLSLLFLMDGNNILDFPKDTYERMEKLEVVSYQNMSIPLLPVTSELSARLRTLCVRSSSLINDDIHLLGNLINLETLSLAQCRLKRLPSTIGKLKKLKLLDLTGCVNLCIDDHVFENLFSLEELYLTALKGMPIRFTEANLFELKIRIETLIALEMEFYHHKAQPKDMSFKRLERFRISVGCEMKFEEKHFLANTLYLVDKIDVLKKCNINDLLEKTEELHIQVEDMNHIENVSMSHSFDILRVLHVSMCRNLTYLFTVDMANDLKKLERLTISECPNMRTMVGENNKISMIKFHKLKFLSLKDLPNMVSLSKNKIELPAIMELILDGLPNFTSICSDNNNTSEMRSLFNKSVQIPRLEKLDISMMENLKQIWPSEDFTTEKNCMSMLSHIRVRECDSLINVFPNNSLPLLNHLEEIEVEHCGSIEVLFNINFKNLFEMNGYICTLKRIKVNELGKLRELWRIGDVISDLDIVINGFKGVESIEITECKRFENIFTPTTINFDLTTLTTYLAKENGQEMNDCIHNVTYPSCLINNFNHLQRLELEGEERLEVVFQEPKENEDSHEPILLPYLEVLNLYRLEEMSHVWKCKWNKFTSPQHERPLFPFQNLKDISLRHCHNIKYLFSPLMGKYLSNLKCVDIYICHSIEEVFSSIDDENEENTTSTSSDINTTYYPNLDVFKFYSLRRLKRIDSGDTRSTSGKIFSSISPDTIHDEVQSAQDWLLFQYPRRISIDTCHALSTLFPCYAVRQTKRLEELKIENCKTMIKVFESEYINKGNNNVDEHGITLTTPTLVVHQLSNLKSVCIYECGLLPHIFTFSILKSLNQLKELEVKRCKGIQVIVKEENESSSKCIELPCLETLSFEHLPNLKGFFVGINEFKFPLLYDVMINDCPQLTMFTYGQSKTPKLMYVRTRLGKHSLECGLNFRDMNNDQTTFPSSSHPNISKGLPCSFHNVIELNIEHANVETVIPSNMLPQLEKLEQIHVTNSFWVEVVFGVALEGTDKSGLIESQTVVKIPELTQIYLYSLRGLKYLWKSNQRMVLEFPKLTSVSIHDCTMLEHVFTCSVVGSLVQLQDLLISGGDSIQVIVKKEEEDRDAEMNEIVLPYLKSIKLEGLPKLKGFCLGEDAFSLPNLNTLHIKDCPAITTFTKGHLATPKLKVINTTIGMHYVSTDLNSFIKNKQRGMSPRT